MSVKKLTELRLTDLMKEYKGLWKYWQEHDEAVKEFRRRQIERALEIERTDLVGCEHYERTETRIDYRAGYWKRRITLKNGHIQGRMPKIRVGVYESNVMPVNFSIKITGT